MKGFTRAFSGVLLVCMLCLLCLWRQESLPDLSGVAAKLQDSVGQINTLSDLIEGGIPGITPSTPELTDPDAPYVEGTPAPGVDTDFETALVTAIVACEETVDVSAFALSAADLKQQVSQVFFTHPELFYVNTAYRIGTPAGSTIVSQVQLEYLYEKDKIPAMIATYEAAVDEIVAGVDPAGSDFDKILYLHDYFIRHYSYDYVGLQNGNAIRDAYTFFTEKTGVCQAYMLGLIAVCDEVGLECLPVTSTEMNHAWNLVKIDGEWYHIDVTWDDAGGETAAVYPSYVSYDYFLLSGEKLYNDGRKVAWSATQSATATVYDNVVWREDAHLPLVKKGDSYYCIVYDGNPVILSGTATEMTAMRELTGVYWTSSQGGMYMRSWSGFAAYGDALVFNTSSALYFYQPETNMPTRIAELSASLGGLQIFGIVDVTDGVVTYVAAADYQGEFELRTYTIA